MCTRRHNVVSPRGVLCRPTIIAEMVIFCVYTLCFTAVLNITIACILLICAFILFCLFWTLSFERLVVNSISEMSCTLSSGGGHSKTQLTCPPRNNNSYGCVSSLATRGWAVAIQCVCGTGRWRRCWVKASFGLQTQVESLQFTNSFSGRSSTPSVGNCMRNIFFDIILF